MYLNVQGRPSIVLNGGGLSPMQIKALKHVPCAEDKLARLGSVGFYGYFGVPAVLLVIGLVVLATEGWQLPLVFGGLFMASWIGTFIKLTPIRKDHLFDTIRSNIPDYVEIYPLIGGKLDPLREICGQQPWAKYFEQLAGRTDLSTMLVSRLIQYINDLLELELFDGKVGEGDKLVVDTWIEELKRYTAEDLRKMYKSYNDQTIRVLQIKSKLGAAEQAAKSAGSEHQATTLATENSQVFRDTFLVLE